MSLVRLPLADPSEARSGAHGGAADTNGFKIGDTVQVNTGFGWIEGRNPCHEWK
jgi:hypothetical protein